MTQEKHNSFPANIVLLKCKIRDILTEKRDIFTEKRDIFTEKRDIFTEKRDIFTEKRDSGKDRKKRRGRWRGVGGSREGEGKGDRTDRFLRSLHASRLQQQLQMADVTTQPRPHPSPQQQSQTPKRAGKKSRNNYRIQPN